MNNTYNLLTISWLAVDPMMSTESRRHARIRPTLMTKLWLVQQPGSIPFERCCAAGWLRSR